GFGRVRGRPRGGRTGAGSVGLGVGGADDGVAAGADPALAGVGLRAGIAVAAGAAIGLRRVRARPCGGRTGAGSVALVGGGAEDGVAAGADPALTGVGLRAGVPVAARRPVRLRWIRAEAGCGITCPGDVALVGGSAADRVAARARPALACVGLRARVAVVARRRVVHVLAAGRRIAAVVGAGVAVVAVKRRPGLTCVGGRVAHLRAVADGAVHALRVLGAAARHPLVDAAARPRVGRGVAAVRRARGGVAAIGRGPGVALAS